MRRHGSLVTKLVHFCYRVIHLEMVPYFLTHIHLFDQSEEEMAKHGQTHAQYACYQRYSELLNVYLEAFSRREGFASVDACFAAVQRAISVDSSTQADLMLAIQDQLQRVEAEINKQRALLSEARRRAGITCESSGGSRSTGGGGGRAAGDSGDDDDDDDFASLLAELDAPVDETEAHDAVVAASTVEQSSVPSVVFMLPTRLETLVDSVLKLMTYNSFSEMMRRKAMQLRTMLEAEVKRQQGLARRSRMGGDADSRAELFAELRERLCELTPNRQDLHMEASKEMDTESFEGVCSRPSPRAAKRAALPVPPPHAQAHSRSAFRRAYPLLSVRVRAGPDGRRSGFDDERVPHVAAQACPLRLQAYSQPLLPGPRAYREAAQGGAGASDQGRRTNRWLRRHAAQPRTRGCRSRGTRAPSISRPHVAHASATT